MHDFDHHLLWLHGGKNALAYSLILDLVAEILGNLVTDVCIQQGLADILDGFRNLSSLSCKFSNIAFH